jgi:hypothetical protein
MGSSWKSLELQGAASSTVTAIVYRTKVPFRSVGALCKGLNMDLLLIVGLAGVVFGGGCAVIASNKRRDPLAWFVLGFLFNIVALIVIAVLTPSEEAATLKVGRRDAGLDDSPNHDELRKKAAELSAALARSKAKLSN